MNMNEHGNGEHSGQKYFVNIEGTEYPWDKETITLGEIRTLGAFPSDVPIVEEDSDGGERTLSDNEAIVLKPGHRLGRAPKYRRGNQERNDDHSGKKYYVNIEGTEYLWDKDTINLQEIRTLGTIPEDVPVIEEDPEGTERTLSETEAIVLKPGHRLGRAPKYRRGNEPINERRAAEIDMVRHKFPVLQHGERMDWVVIPDYPLPPGRYHKKSTTRLLFLLPPGYPNTGPDNFFVEGDLRLASGGSPPGFNPGANSPSGTAPLVGDWGWFSWHPQSWRPAAIVEGGDNLVTFLRGVNLCLQGVEQT